MTANEPVAPSMLSATLRAQLLELAEEPSTGRVCAESLRATVETWWSEQQALEQELARRLRTYHEINNALVGVRGNAQLLLLGSCGSEPRLRDRLEVIIRESERIAKAAQQFREIRALFARSGPSHAA